MSSTSCCLMISSSVYSFYKEGEEFTSSSQHFKSVSMIISYPNSSKQFGLTGITFMHEINDFRTIYLICLSISLQDIPAFSSLSLSIRKDILHPPSCCYCVSFRSLIFSLLMLKLVRCINLFYISVWSIEYFSVLNLANPSLYMKASSGLIEVTRT